MKEKYRKEFEQVFGGHTKGLKDKDLTKLQERLKEMINYAIGRVDYYERTRTTYQTIALGIIGASLTLIVLLVNQIDKIEVHVFTLFSIGFTILIAGAIRILMKYFKETSPTYPHRSVSDIKSWYFKYYLKYSGKIVATPKESELNSLVNEYSEQFKKYIGTWVSHAKDLKKTILEDIEQVFILYAIQNYKMEFTRQMKEVLRTHILWFSIFLFAGLAILLAEKILKYCYP